MHSVLNTFSEYAYFNISKDVTLYAFYLFLKSLKAFSVSLRLAKFGTSYFLMENAGDYELE